MRTCCLTFSSPIRSFRALSGPPSRVTGASWAVPVPAGSVFSALPVPQASRLPLPVLVRPSTASRSPGTDCTRPPPAFSRAVQFTSDTGSVDSTRKPSFSAAPASQPLSEPCPPSRTTKPWPRAACTVVRFAVSVPPPSTATPSSPEVSTRKSRRVTLPPSSTRTPQPSLPVTPPPATYSVEPAPARTPAPFGLRISQSSARPRASLPAVSPSPAGSTSRARRSSGLAPPRTATAGAPPITSRRSSSAAESSSSSTPASSQSRTVRPVTAGEEAPSTFTAAACANSTQQSSSAPRARSVTSSPWPRVREVRQRRSTGSVPPASTMPPADVCRTRTSSRVARPALVMCTPVLVSCTTVRITRVVQRSSRAIDGLSVEEMSQSSTVPRASPLARTPLPRASRTVQPRTVASPCSASTTPLVPRCSMEQDSTELPAAEVTTTPAPLGLLTRQSRSASDPVPAASSAVHEEPVISQPSSAACPRRTSTAGSSGSAPRSVSSESITASARRDSTLPECGRISTDPRPSAAVMVTRVCTTRFSAYEPGPTLMTAPLRAAANASPIVR